MPEGYGRYGDNLREKGLEEGQDGKKAVSLKRNEETVEHNNAADGGFRPYREHGSNRAFDAGSCFQADSVWNSRARGSEE
jgi:hypothetical protein